MKWTPQRIAIIVGSCSLALLGVAAWWNRLDLEFHWRLSRVASWGEGAYIESIIRRDLPTELVHEEEWFVEHRRDTRPRLASALNGSVARKKQAALELLGRCDAEDGKAIDPDLYWEAFEDLRAVNHFLDSPQDVLILVHLPGVHGGGSWTAQLTTTEGSETRVWFCGLSLAPQLRTLTLRAERRLRHLRGLARLVTLPALPGAAGQAPGEESVLRLEVYAQPRDSRLNSRFELKQTLGLCGWRWHDEVIAMALERSNAPDESEAVPYEPEEAAELFCALLSRGPEDAVKLARLSLEHPLLSESIRRAVRELEGRPRSARETGGGSRSGSPPVSE